MCTHVTLWLHVLPAEADGSARGRPSIFSWWAVQTNQPRQQAPVRGPTQQNPASAAASSDFVSSWKLRLEQLQKGDSDPMEQLETAMQWLVMASTGRFVCVGGATMALVRLAFKQKKLASSPHQNTLHLP